MIKTSPSIDVAAVALSLGCMVHCLLLPLAASALPLFGSAEEAEWVHWTFVALAAPVSVVALRHAHAAGTLMAALRTAAAAGVALLIVGATRWPEPAWETPLTISGALVLAAAHAVNGLTRHVHRRAAALGPAPPRAEASPHHVS